MSFFIRFAPLVCLIAVNIAWADDAYKPKMALLDLQGNTHQLSDYRGKWVIVNYWATWCPPCLEELPELEVFYNNHAEKDAVVLGVNWEEIDDAHLKAFVEEQFLSFPILRAEPTTAAIGRIPGLPTTFFVAPDGRAVGRRVGSVTAELLEQRIEIYSKRLAAEAAEKEHQESGDKKCESC